MFQFWREVSSENLLSLVTAGDNSQKNVALLSDSVLDMLEKSVQRDIHEEISSKYQYQKIKKQVSIFSSYGSIISSIFLRGSNIYRIQLFDYWKIQF